jgi:hypothetical protein
MREVMNTKRDIIATLLKAKRPDLANAVAKQEVKAAEELPLDQAPDDAIALFKAIHAIPEQYFEGVHGKILQGPYRSYGGSDVLRFDVNTVKKISGFHGLRWFQANSKDGSIGIGF